MTAFLVITFLLPVFLVGLWCGLALSERQLLQAHRSVEEREAEFWASLAELGGRHG